MHSAVGKDATCIVQGDAIQGDRMQEGDAKRRCKKAKQGDAMQVRRLPHQSTFYDNLIIKND